MRIVKFSVLGELGAVGKLNSTVKAGGSQRRLALGLSVSVLWLLLLVASVSLIACGDQPTPTPNSNATLATNVVGKWVQVSQQGLGQLFSATKQGDIVEFMPDGTLDLGGTGAVWKMLDNGKLQYTVSSHSFIFDLIFSTSKGYGNVSDSNLPNELVMNGGGEGGQRTVSFQRKV